MSTHSSKLTSSSAGGTLSVRSMSSNSGGHTCMSDSTSGMASVYTTPCSGLPRCSSSMLSIHREILPVSFSAFSMHATAISFKFDFLLTARSCISSTYDVICAVWVVLFRIRIHHSSFLLLVVHCLFVCFLFGMDDRGGDAFAVDDLLADGFERGGFLLGLGFGFVKRRLLSGALGAWCGGEGSGDPHQAPLHAGPHTQKGRQKGRQEGRKAGRQACRQAGRQAGRQAFARTPRAVEVKR